MTVTNRRTFFKAAGAAVATSVAGAAAAKETSIRRDYRKWLSIRDEYNASGPECQFDQMVQLERKIIGTRPTSVEDYAIKILVTDNDGDMNLDAIQIALVEEAKCIVS